MLVLTGWKSMPLAKRVHHIGNNTEGVWVYRRKDGKVEDGEKLWFVTCVTIFGDETH